MISGHLFTRDFLLEGINRETAWQAIDPRAFDAFCDELLALAKAMASSARPNEAETEQSFIYPVLSLLGWNDRLVQQTVSAKGRKQVPDVLLFQTARLARKRLRNQTLGSVTGMARLYSKPRGGTGCSTVRKARRNI